MHISLCSGQLGTSKKKNKKLFKLTIHRLNRIQKSKPQRAGGNVPTAEPLVLLYIDIINIVINI